MHAFYRKLVVILALALLLPAAGVLAQEATPEATPDAPAWPNNYLMDGFTYHAQWWNNCGPATVTMALSYFGYVDDQGRAANWLKPNGEDKNVSPWQMETFVNTQVPEIPVYSMVRYGGTLDTLRTLVANDFPVIIEAGYDPESAAQGWMGHYLLVKGYDDSMQQVITNDSYDGENLRYSYAHIEEFWQHFNYAYMVLFTSDREAELLDLLGPDADDYENLIRAFEIAQEEAIFDPDDSFAWHNMGAVLVRIAEILGEDSYYEQAKIAFDQARNVGDGLPWRMLWYQFEMYEAYNAIGEYETTLELVRGVMNDGGGHFVEETFYYAGVAREALGENQRAIDNYNKVLSFNPNFTSARDRRDALINRGRG